MVTLQLSAREFRLLAGCYATLVILRLDAEKGHSSEEGATIMLQTIDEMHSLGISGLDRLRAKLQRIVEENPTVARGVFGR